MFDLFDLPALIETVGYAGIAAIAFAESGLFFGFFLPGDSLLFTAGFLASQGFLNIWLLAPIVTVSAILGDSVGYWSGKKIGPMLFTKPDSFWFSRERIADAKKFFDKHGGMSLILARFVPFFRTFVPIIAGTAQMEYRKFLTYNVIGGIIWGTGVPFLGYFLGSLIPDIDTYLLPIIGAMVLLSLIPVASEFFKYWKSPKGH